MVLAELSEGSLPLRDAREFTTQAPSPGEYNELLESPLQPAEVSKQAVLSNPAA